MKPIIAVLIHQPLQDQLIASADRERLEALGEVRWWKEARPAEAEEAVELLRDCTCAIGSWGTVHPGNEGLLKQCPDLCLWVHAAGSVKRFFTPEVRERDQLKISSCKDAIGTGVAEQTVACAIMGLRNWMGNAGANRLGQAGKPAGMRLLGESVVGLIGASVVGRLVIEQLRPIGCPVLMYDPYLKDEEAAAMGVEKVEDLTDLCRRSDVVSLHTPLLPATENLLQAAHFQAMSDDTVVINTSRGGCLDQEALQAELEKGRLHAFLDVTSPGTLPDEHPLRKLPNCHLTSHIAGPPSSLIGRQAVDDVAAVLRGGQPRSLITPAILEHIG
ncbi:MAG: hydroxyacid dehydrogenase [Opitutales bacterium]|nr:hydroxyacid dehydrogenase [Opitutales bacterium]